jgi:peptidoglycan/LPS O-acetylase OafA/YrhL
MHAEETASPKQGDPTTARSTDATTKEGFRLDIQGLRAVAVLLVAFQHANVPSFGGGYIGVDVFFVISGFLITRWLLKNRSRRTGRVGFRRFYAARARRILPAAVLTLVATDIASLLLLNPVRALSAFHDSVWAAFFAANVHFSSVATNYLASSAPPSPIQQYWSLAVEEQFYLAWPALVMVAAYFVWKPLVTRSRRSGRARFRWHLADNPKPQRIALVLGLIVLLSFAWSIIDTTNNPAAAYFSTFTRAWELGVGALLAVGAGWVSQLPVRLRSLASWIGLGGILVSAVMYGANTAFPGFAALVPVLGAAFVIAGGMRPTGMTASALLGRQPLVFIGDVSYSFYLWHWPVLILVKEHLGHSLSTWSSVLLLCIAFGLSVVTYRFYENPLRHTRFLRKRRWSFVWLWSVSILSVILASSVLGASATNALTRSSSSEVAAGTSISTTPIASLAPDGATLSPPGTSTTPTAPIAATSILSGTTSTTANPNDPYVAAVAASVSPTAQHNPVPDGLSPSFETLALDFPVISHCAAGTNDATGPICHFGKVGSGRTLVVFGDSHALMWMTPLSRYAATRGWSLVPIIKVACSAAAAAGVQPSGSCAQWYPWAIAEIKQLKPAAIVFSESYFSSETRGLTTEVDALRAISPTVVVFEDTPQMSFTPTDCLLAPNATLGQCTTAVTSSLTDPEATIQSVARSAGAVFLPTWQWFCYDDLCPSVINKMIVYIDTAHVSNTYASYLTNPLARELDQVLP